MKRFLNWLADQPCCFWSVVLSPLGLYALTVCFDYFYVPDYDVNSAVLGSLAVVASFMAFHWGWSVGDLFFIKCRKRKGK